MAHILFIDIETVACTDEFILNDIRATVTHPKTIKLQKSIDTWSADKRPQAELDAISKTSFDGLAGEIICIGFAVNDEEPKTLWRNVDESEKVLLERFFDLLINVYGKNFNPVYCGHNIAGFDLPFLYKRCLVNNVKPSVILPRNPTAWSRDVFDTLFEVTGKNMAGGSLDRISKILGIGSKTEGFDGSMVNQAWHDGKIVEIAEYCKQDVYLTRELYKRILFIDSVADAQRPDDFK